jgi:hypothetical protein
VLAAGSSIKLWTLTETAGEHTTDIDRLDFFKCHSLFCFFADTSNKGDLNLSAAEEYQTVELATAVTQSSFSPDGAYFATASRNDMLVKVWYSHRQSKSTILPSLPLLIFSLLLFQILFFVSST